MASSDVRKAAIVEAKIRGFFVQADLARYFAERARCCPDLRIRTSEAQVSYLCDGRHGSVTPRDDEWALFCAFLDPAHLHAVLTVALDVAPSTDVDPMPELIDATRDASGLTSRWYSDGVDGHTRAEVQAAIVAGEAVQGRITEALRNMRAKLRALTVGAA